MNPYEYLAMAIVEQAANDYRKQMKHHGKATAIERFFRSEWGNLLCFGKADLILEKLQDEQIRRKIQTFKRGYNRHEKFKVDENTVAVTVYFTQEDNDEWETKGGEG